MVGEHWSHQFVGNPIGWRASVHMWTIGIDHVPKMNLKQNDPELLQNQHARELNRSKYITRAQRQKPESPMVTLTWQCVNTRYINSTSLKHWLTTSCVDHMPFKEWSGKFKGGSIGQQVLNERTWCRPKVQSVVGMGGRLTRKASQSVIWVEDWQGRLVSYLGGRLTRKASQLSWQGRLVSYLGGRLTRKASQLSGWKTDEEG